MKPASTPVAKPTRHKAANAFRFAFAMVTLFAVIAAPEYCPLILAILAGVFILDLVFAKIKKWWKTGNDDFTKIMNEELR